MNELIRSTIKVDNLSRRLDALRSSAAYKNYLNIRDNVLSNLQNGQGADNEFSQPSAYWREELANFEYLLDASPLIIEKLRHHCFHVTGLRVYDYRTNKAKDQLATKLRMLDALGHRELRVPESPILGGFGFEIDGQLYNVDTLKFYEALIALKLGGVLGDFSKNSERRIVWEIGAGWGGFAYQFKTLFPHVTYVIVDLPELFLFSGVYLQTAFPDARVFFYRPGHENDLENHWADYDFIFIPNIALSVLRPPRLDLVVNLVSFQEMTTDQVRTYVQKAYELNCLYLYSLNRDRSLYNNELTSVSDLIGEHFWPREIHVLDLQYTQMPSNKTLKSSLKATLAGSKKPDLSYKHLVAWRKVAK